MSLIALDPPAAVVSCGLIATRASSTDAVTILDRSHSGSRRMDRYAALGCAAASAALENAGEVRLEQGDPDWGVVLGSSLGCWASNAEFLVDLDDRPTPELSPGLFVRTVANAVNGEICIAHGIGGINHTVVSGWAAGAEAVAEAAALLAEGRARWILTGGVESPNDSLRRVHAAVRLTEDLRWLPETLEEAAAICLVTTGNSLAPADRTRILAYRRGHDPQGRWLLSTVLEPSVGTVVVTNSTPPDLLRSWREQAGNRRFVYLPAESGELGAAGAPLVLATASRFKGGLSSADRILVIARGIEGGTAALLLDA